MTPADVYEPTALFGSLGPFLIALAALIGGIVGRARWKDAAESSSHRANEAEKEVARLEATCLEKAHALELANERAAQLEGVITTVGGAKVFEALHQHEDQAAERHTQRMAQSRKEHRQLLAMFETVGHALGDLAAEIHNSNDADTA